MERAFNCRIGKNLYEELRILDYGTALAQAMPMFVVYLFRFLQEGLTA
jgi:hypothetical protein